MGLLDRLKSFLTDENDTGPGRATAYGSDSVTDRYDSGASPSTGTIRTGTPRRSEDEVAVDRYRYLLRTAPPDAMEEAHAEAFAKLTPRQRRMVFEELSNSAAPVDRPASEDPRVLARSATRSELRQPGFLERTFGSTVGGTGRGPGIGTVIGGSLLGTVAGVVIGSAIADMVLPGIGDMAADFGGGLQDFGQDIGDGAQDAAAGVGDFGDFGGGGGDFGGDF